jgi:hypothetical protein
MVAAATLMGMAAELIVGYSALAWHHRRTRRGHEKTAAVGMADASPAKEDET